METAIAKGPGPMVLTGGAVLAGSSTTDAWIVPVIIGVFAVGLTAFLVARSMFTRRNAAAAAHKAVGGSSR